MDGQTDKQTENLPILQDFVPYLSVCLSVCLFDCFSLYLSVFLWIESWEGLSPKLVQVSPELGQIEPQIKLQVKLQVNSDWALCWARFSQNWA